MANLSLSHSISELNQQVEHLNEFLIKAEALTEVLLAQENLSLHSSQMVYHYLWAISDFIEQARCSGDKLSTGLLKLSHKG